MIPDFRFQIPLEWRKTVGMMECQSWTTFQRLEKGWGQEHLKRPSHKTIKTQDHITRPHHKTIKTQDHLTRPFHQTTKTQDKTISDVDCTTFRIHSISQAEKTNKQKEIEKLDLGSATFQILDTLAHSLYWPSRLGQVAQWFTFRI